MAEISYLQSEQTRGGGGSRQMMLPEPDEGDFEIRHLFRTLWRRKLVVFATMLIITLFTGLWVFQVTPLYRSEAGMVVETKRQNLVAIESVLQGGGPDYYTNETEAAIIASREFANTVVEEYGLMLDPNFNPELDAPASGLVAELIQKVDFPGLIEQVVPEWLALELGLDWLPGAKRERPTDAGAQEWERNLVIDEFLGKLDVVTSPRSRVIGIRFTAADPKLAAAIANRLAKLYIDQSLRAKTDANLRASDWVGERLGELQAKRDESNARLQAYRRKIGLVDVKGQQDLLVQQLSEFNRQLITVRNDRAELEARYKQVKQLLTDPGGMESAASVLNAPLIQRLREQEALQVRVIADLSTKLRDKHPRMISARKDLEDLQGKIAGEVKKIASAQKHELEVARIKERDLRASIGKLRKEVETQKAASVELQVLAAEAKADNDLYETFVARAKETDILRQGDPNQPDARLISPAVPPVYPAFPRKKVILAIALVGSALLGVVFVFLLEVMDSGFRSMQQFEGMSGQPAIGLIPAIKGTSKRHGPADHIVSNSATPYSEAIRSLRTALHLSNIDAPPKIILFTSSQPAEGKTSTAVSMARAAAIGGQRALIIDCDLRRPSLHTVLRTSNETGLFEFLAGQTALEDVIRFDEPTGAHYITSGGQAPNPGDLLSSSRMRDAIQQCADAYDLVVIDTPPLLAVSDARVLFRLADKTVFLVRWGKTKREAVLAALRHILEAGGNFAGAVLTQVDMKKNARYHYGDAGYYHSDYQKYYGS